MLVTSSQQCLFIYQIAALDVGVATGPGELEEVYKSTVMEAGGGTDGTSELLEEVLAARLKELTQGSTELS